MRSSIASIALIRREVAGQTLWLAQWNDAWNAFNFVGGHKHDNESFRECLVREIEEELGLSDGHDVLVASAPLQHLEYTDISQRTGEQTAYVIELFDVALLGDRALATIDANPANRWLSEAEIGNRSCGDGRAVSDTISRLLKHADIDVSVQNND
jgi:8-oxo-dGTP pyrophosphatase MutT (NUDIX family)